ncbi:MAG: hemerythrin family protein [Spirochaetaceae bacterium]|nr:bacteriohemerythrin [Spirochaetaceae bacterium]MBP3450840.1 hemerythrin family protein [Spirochaetaceae bacterium]MBQ7904286.1 hemerythrin family protein [Spirochaetaceae bacterium]
MAVKFEWNEIYELGIPEIDLQHKKLISISNELYDVATKGDVNLKITMSKILKNLTDYTVYHFTSEEEFMKKYGYQGAPMHKIAHDNFVAEVTQQIKNLSEGSQEDVLLFYDYIANWILAHIAKADKIWATFVKEKM